MFVVSSQFTVAVDHDLIVFSTIVDNVYLSVINNVFVAVRCSRG